MDPNIRSIASLLLDTFMAVKAIFPEMPTPMTIISKSMLDAGIKQGIFLASLRRQDEPLETAEPLPLMGNPIYVNMWIRNDNEEDFLIGNVSCFGYNIDVGPVRWTLDYTLEEFSELLTVRNNAVRLPGIERPG